MRSGQIGNLLFRIRSYTPLPFVAIALIFSNATLKSMVVGVCFIIAGEILRIWSVGYAGPTTRATRMSAARDLVTTGPYAYTRNPIYIGNILIVLGLTIMSGIEILLPVALVWFIVQYRLIVTSEEAHLLAEVGESYERYLGSVPRFLFRWSPYLYRSNHDFSLRRALRSERQTLIGIVSMSILIALAARYWAI